MSFCIICVKKLINRFEILDQTGSSAQEYLIPPTSRTNQAGKWREKSGTSQLSAGIWRIKRGLSAKPSGRQLPRGGSEHPPTKTTEAA